MQPKKCGKDAVLPVRSDSVAELETILTIDLRSDADLDLLLLASQDDGPPHGIRGWACISADDIADILNTVLRKSPSAGRSVRSRYKVEYCPNCGYPVKPMRATHLALCKRSAVFRQIKTPSPYICRQCNLDLRNVKIT
ncbi:MAG: hypothetical protein EHM48_07940 [Planctomycetaceae bacterium]|nr:MAG: hypothetical protein EHM48_07940 [Planctomycetaceae bacterium]